MTRTDLLAYKHSYFLALLLLLLGVGCDKQPPQLGPEPGDCLPLTYPISDPLAGEAPSERVWILNEGNFQWGNASLGWYEPSSASYFPSVFDSLEQEPLGDVLQSMAFWEGKAYLVVNNSGKIEVLDAEWGLRTGTITGLTSPRYFLGLTAEKAYVTDLYADAVSVVDLEAETVAGSIPLPGWTEQMQLAANQVFITNPERPWLYVVDPTTDQLVDSIALRRGGSALVQDGQGDLWVACGEDMQDSTAAALYRIDPVTRSVAATYEFPAGERPGSLAISPDGQWLYFLQDGLRVMATDAAALPDCATIEAGGGLFYGLAVDPANGDVYLSDAVDYVQRGVLLRYDRNLAPVDEFRAGIIPGACYFQP